MLSEEKKKRILEFIDTYVRKNGYSPSYREIAEAVGIKSPSTVSNYVHCLSEENKLVLHSGQPRSMTTAKGEAKSACRRICLETADGGEISFDFSVQRGKNNKLVCSFDGIVDASRWKGPVSRVVRYFVEEAATR